MSDRMFDAYENGRYQFSVKAPDSATALQRAQTLNSHVSVSESRDKLLPLVPVWPERYEVDWI